MPAAVYSQNSKSYPLRSCFSSQRMLVSACLVGLTSLYCQILGRVLHHLLVFSASFDRFNNVSFLAKKKLRPSYQCWAVLLYHQVSVGCRVLVDLNINLTWVLVWLMCVSDPKYQKLPLNAWSDLFVLISCLATRVYSMETWQSLKPC